MSRIAEINGSLFETTLEISGIGSYEQLGPVDFNSQELRNLSVVSGNLDGVDIGLTTKGKLYLQI